MPDAVPRILVIDDDLGSDSSDARDAFCEALCLEPNLWPAPPPTSVRKDRLALATFVSAQQQDDDWTENDLQIAIDAISSGWPFKDGGGRWALICLDMNFFSGKDGKSKSEQFGRTILEAIQKRNVPSNVKMTFEDHELLPIIMLSGDPEDTVERQLGVEANVPIVAKWSAESSAEPAAALRQFARLLFSKALIQDGALRHVNAAGKVEPVARTTPVMIGASLGMLTTLRDARSILARGGDARILVTGDRGSGKELIAGYLHDHRNVVPSFSTNGAPSPLGRAPLLEVVHLQEVPRDLFAATLKGHEAGAFTGASKRVDGKIAKSGTGTLHLDEIANLRLEDLQILLRLVEGTRYDRVGGSGGTLKVECQIVATTNKNMTERLAKNEFPADLYDRFEKLSMPPLRDRPEDIKLLFETFLADEVKRLGYRAKTIDADVLNLALAQPWPGNVRQLRSVVRTIVSNREYASRITASDFERASAGTGDRMRATWSGGLDELIALISEFELAKSMQIEGVCTQLDQATLRLFEKLIREAVARNGKRKLEVKALVNRLTAGAMESGAANRWLYNLLVRWLDAFGHDTRDHDFPELLYDLLSPENKGRIDGMIEKKNQKAA